MPPSVIAMIMVRLMPSIHLLLLLLLSLTTGVSSSVLVGASDFQADPLQQRLLQFGVVGTPAPVFLPPPTETEWEDLAFVFQWSLYSSSTGTSITGLSRVELALEERLKGSLLDQDQLPEGTNVVVNGLDSVLQGACDSQAIPFPNYPVCIKVESTITVKVGRDDNLDADIFQEVVFAEVRYFADEFNSDTALNQNIARMSFVYPIEVNVTMLISLMGVSTKMDDEEQAAFLEIIRTGLTGILETSQETVEFELVDVTIVFQEASGSAQRKLGLRSLQGDANSYNKVHLSVTAVCGNPDTCTDQALQDVLDAEGPDYAQVLEVALFEQANGDQPYFSDLNDVIIGEEQNSLPKLPPTTVVEQEEKDKDKFPLWLGILIFASLLVVATAICWDMRRRKNGGGQKLVDPERQRKRELEDDSEYSEKEDHFNSYGKEEEPVDFGRPLEQMKGDEHDEDQHSLGDEFSLDGGEISVYDPGNDNEGGMSNGEIFRAPRRTRQVSRGRSKRYNHR